MRVSERNGRRLRSLKRDVFHSGYLGYCIGGGGRYASQSFWYAGQRTQPPPLLAVVGDSRALPVALEFVQLAVAPRSTIARDLTLHRSLQLENIYLNGLSPRVNVISGRMLPSRSWHAAHRQ